MAKIVAWAAACGAIGMIGAGVGTEFLHPGASDPTMNALIAAAYGGAVGWLIGIAVGMARHPDSEATDRMAWALRLGAVAVIALGIWIAPSALTASGPQIDGVGLRSPLRPILAFLLWVDTAIAAGTLLTLSFRRRVEVPCQTPSVS